MSRKSFDGPQTIKFQNRDYLLVPIDSKAASEATRGHRLEPQRYDDPDLEDMKEYSYKPLPTKTKRIRLLKLRSGKEGDPRVFCRIIEADYDNEFHIPTKPKEYEQGTDRKSKGMDKKLSETVDQTVHTAATKPKKTEKQQIEELVQRHREVKRRRIKYEALSWCWGTGKEDYAVQIVDKKKKTIYKKKVRKELALALRYLRKPEETRILWIDAICINQRDDTERNQQVQLMSRIYTRAKEVCIWLGEDTHESKMAIDFIREEITQLNNFDEISSNQNYADKWRALMFLMQRDWFSRRWVVQEIALARRAKIYCGPDSIEWREFAVAVELFVEVETATHRLSEVMLKTTKYKHVPNWFEHVSELGASLLVQATGKVFRSQTSPMEYQEEEEEEDQACEETAGLSKTTDDEVRRLRDVQTIDPLDRRSLLSLEYLVTSMFIFNATEPRDSIYSMLAIARDANPFAESSLRADDVSILTMSLFDSFLAEKPFIVNYARPYVDVCRDFVKFCIDRKRILEPVQALDILCRPWALDSPKTSSSVVSTAKPKVIATDTKAERQKPVRKWRKAKYKIVVEQRPEGLHFVYVYPKDPKDVEYEPDPRDMDDYWADTKDDVNKEGRGVERNAQTWVRPKGWKRVCKLLEGFDRSKKPSEASEQTNGRSSYSRADHNLAIPSWVAKASKAPFRIFPHPGIHIHKTGRANADSLVGQSQDGHRNYSAAQTRPATFERLQFKKRPVMGHYSLYVEGFELDEVDEVRDASQGGDIPQSWLELGGWNEPYKDDPPSEFWRTIVADRGHDNRNPPYYYARACRESVLKGGIGSGRVATMDLINNERNSIIAEFCRRVHAVIWGRSLFRTKQGRLGLGNGVRKGDKVCILYGCTVPVILEEHEKNPGESGDEEFEDIFEKLRATLEGFERRCVRKARYRAKIESNGDWQKEIRDDIEVVKERSALKATREKPDRVKQDLTDTEDTEPRKRHDTDEFKEGSQSGPSTNEHAHGDSSNGRQSGQPSAGSTGEVLSDMNTPSQVTGSSQPSEGAGDNQHSQMARDDQPSSAVFHNDQPSQVIDDSQPLQATEGGQLPQGIADVQPSQVVDAGQSSNKEDTSPEVTELGAVAATSEASSKDTSDERTKAAEKEAARVVAHENKNKYYIFKGESYVHGFMDGEAVREKFYKDLSDKMFELR